MKSSSSETGPVLATPLSEPEVARLEPWWVNGILYENCNCQLLCPAHVSFKQRCDYERCLGFWGIHVEKGRFGQLVLSEQDAVILFDAAQLMHSPDWTVEIYLDDNAEEAERKALEQILTGEAGGPWRLLGKFVVKRLETRLAPIHFEDDGKRKILRIEGVLESEIGSVLSKRSGQPATLGNLFNVVHSAMQYLANGSSKVNDQAYRWTTENSHALYSEFAWTGP